ncbi:MAG: class Ib ribonucleoside-diphosphate reductase assembly flavoprotein NrdI [Lysinibacillus sp.]
MIAYASRTGNVSFVVSKLNLPNIEINEVLEMKRPFLLFTYTDGLGEVPMQVARFMERNHQHCRGIIVSGNSNFGHHVFGQAGDKLALQYGIPLVCKLDLRGFSQDYEKIQQFYHQRIKEVVT